MQNNPIEDVGPKINSSDIAHFEGILGWSLPEDYVQFLLERNGGIPAIGFFSVSGRQDLLWIDYLGKLPPKDGGKVRKHGLPYDALDELDERYGAIVPDGYLVIGKACRDDLLLLHEGGAVFVKLMEDPEAESDRSAGIRRIASSFSTFFESLVDEPQE